MLSDMPTAEAQNDTNDIEDGLDELIGSRDARRILQINNSTLTRWVAAGLLKPAGKMPGRTGAFVFRRTDIEHLAAESRCPHCGGVVKPVREALNP